MSIQLGALLVLLAIALDPFSQQLVQFHQGTKFVSELNETEPTRAENMRSGTYKHGNVESILLVHNASLPGYKKPRKASAIIDISMQGAILNGFSSPLNTTHQQANVRCPTGRCTWPPVKTLGVCHICHDITTDLKKVDDFGQVTAALLAGHMDSYVAETIGTYELPPINSSLLVLPNGHFLPGINGCFVTGVTWDNCTYLSPENQPWSADLPIMTSFGSGNRNKTNRMQDLDTLIWATSMIYFDPNQLRPANSFNEEVSKWPDAPIRASECAIYYCVQNIKSEVNGNIIHENATQDNHFKRDPDSYKPDPILTPLHENYAPINIPPDISSLEWNVNYSAIPLEDLVLYNTKNSSDLNYSIADRSIKSISSYFPTLLTTNLTGSPNVTAAIAKTLGEDAVGFNGARTRDDSEPPPMNSIYEPNDFYQNYQLGKKTDLHSTFEVLGASMTNEIRRNGVPDSKPSGSAYWPNEPVYGLIGVETTYYRVEWGWISLHIVVLGGGLLFWLLTVRYSSGCPTWKRSALAVMNQGRTTGQVLEGSKTTTEMEMAARSHKVLIGLSATPVLAVRERRSGSDSSDTPVGP